MKHKQLAELITMLKEKSMSEKVGIWKSIAKELEKPNRKTRIVNLFKIDKHSKENDVIIVPGKVLATGDLNHKVTIAAYSFSNSAIEKIEKVKGEIMTIKKLIEKNPKGEKVKILG